MNFDNFDFSLFASLDSKATYNFLDMPAVIDYMTRYSKQSAAREYYIGFLSAERRHAKLCYIRASVSDMMKLARLSHTSEGLPVLRLDFNMAQRALLEKFACVLAYNGKEAMKETGAANEGFGFENLLASKFANTLQRAPKGISSQHGDDFFIDVPNSARVWFGCKFANGARVELTEASENAFANLYGENPWHTIYAYKGIEQ